jgi:SagB-type dehydrogenase family enzyme
VSEPGLQRAAVRSVRRHPYRPVLALPAPVWPDVSLGEAVRRRRSSADLGGADISLPELSLVLAAADGRTGEIEGPDGSLLFARSAPSGGGLKPLELVVLPLRCASLEGAAHRYDPERHALERFPATVTPDELAEALYQPAIAATCGVFVAVVAVFARTRVKYGLRGYRFALLEAGHVVHGGLLAAAALGLTSLPIGGFVDRRLERLLGLDGVRESVVYSFAVGRDGVVARDGARR